MKNSTICANHQYRQYLAMFMFHLFKRRAMARNMAMGVITRELRSLLAVFSSLRASYMGL
jgi:hypothetical protein